MPKVWLLYHSCQMEKEVHRPVLLRNSLARFQITTMSDEKAARVNGEFLSRHQGERVRIAGEINSPDFDSIKTTDGKMITIHRNGDGTRPTGRWVEVTGRLQSDQSISEEFTVAFEGEVDRDAWNEMVRLMHRHTDIFF